jgi:hypothetical protein
MQEPPKEFRHYPLIFILVYFIYSLKSVFLAFNATLLILLNQGLTNLFVRGIAKISYISYEIQLTHYIITISIVITNIYLMSVAWN